MLYAVISFRRSDGKDRKVPRIYPESIAGSRLDAWRALFENNAGAAAMVAQSPGCFSQIGELKRRLAAHVISVKVVANEPLEAGHTAPSTARCDGEPDGRDCAFDQDSGPEEPEDDRSCVPWWMHWPSYRRLFAAI